MIFKDWPIPGKLTNVNHHGWSSLLHLFKPNVHFFVLATHWAVYQFNFCQEWDLLDLFFVYITIMGVTLLGRYRRPACN